MSLVKHTRLVVLVGAVLSAAFLGATACSAPDPGSITFSARPSGAGGDTSTPTTGGTTSDAGGITKPTADAIFGTTTFAYTDPGQLANGASGDHGGTVVGKDCAQSTACHASGGKGPAWTFAGTLYAAGGKTTIAKGEVMVVGPDGGAVGNAYTDANGNFWYQGGTLPANSKVAVRAEGVTTIQHMATPLLATNSGCSSALTNCHGTTTQGPVHVP